jgi:radical SAM-linked protein
MPRILFEKKGQAIWMSHLDLMRLFQRAFKRAGLPLTHTQGFNPRPSVAIALPLSVGVESSCELLDFELNGEEVACDEIRKRLNETLVDGVKVLAVCKKGRKLKELALLNCKINLEYDNGVPADGVAEIRQLFSREEVIVPKKTKNGLQDQNIIPMIRRLEVNQRDDNEVVIHALICCQNPTLNPMQIPLALQTYLPHLTPNFVKCARLEIFDENEKVFR